MAGTETQTIQEYRQRLQRRFGLSSSELVPAFSFGDTPELADSLGHLVVAGQKRATVGWLDDCAAGAEPLPYAGMISIVQNARGLPLAAIQTTHVWVGVLNDGDSTFARDEGEGDLSLDWWYQAHLTYFSRRAKTLGNLFDPAQSQLCFERFRLADVIGVK